MNNIGVPRMRGEFEGVEQQGVFGTNNADAENVFNGAA